MKEGQFRYKGNIYVLGSSRMTQLDEFGLPSSFNWVPRTRLHEAIKKARGKAGFGRARFCVSFSPSKKLRIGCQSFSPALGAQIAKWAAAGARAHARRKAKGRR